MLLDFLREMPDHRRGQGRRFDLAGVLLVTILALLSGAHSYRAIHTFCATHFEHLREIFDLSSHSKSFNLNQSYLNEKVHYLQEECHGCIGKAC